MDAGAVFHGTQKYQTTWFGVGEMLLSKVWWLSAGDLPQLPATTLARKWVDQGTNGDGTAGARIRDGMAVSRRRPMWVKKAG